MKLGTTFFNTLNHLIDNFDNLDFKKFEIVVVDNASTDRTQEIAFKSRVPGVVVGKQKAALRKREILGRTAAPAKF